MLRSFSAFAFLLLTALFAGTAAPTAAQVQVAVQWDASASGGPYLYAEFGSRGAYVVGAFGAPTRHYRHAGPARPLHVRGGVRIPPGHIPGPGMCRVWYPGVPPGQQPAPFRCASRYHDPYGLNYGYLQQGYPDRRWYDDRGGHGGYDRYDDEDYWDDYEDRYEDYYEKYEDRYEDYRDEYEDWYEDRREDRDDVRRRGPGPIRGGVVIPQRELVGGAPGAQRGRRAGPPMRREARAGWTKIENIAKAARRELKKRNR